MAKIPEQELPVLDPNPPATDKRFSYYILEEPNSPSVAPPNALKISQYRRRQFLHETFNDDDYRRPYGYCEYEHELTFGELDAYNLLPFDPSQVALFDLWQSLDKDKAKLLAFFVQFFKVIEGDPELYRLTLATKLAGKGWTLNTVRAVVKGIK